MLSETMTYRVRGKREFGNPVSIGIAEESRLFSDAFAAALFLFADIEPGSPAENLESTNHLCLEPSVSVRYPNT